MMTGTPPILTFAGAAGTVTGSKTVLDTSEGRILVDCGLFQGQKHLRLQNWAPPPVPPESIDAIVVTHAHLDHCGYIPRLNRLGFSGPVYSTEGTRRLAGIVLPDSGHLQEEEARYANRKGYSKHDPAEPLYTRADAIESLELFETVAFDRPRTILAGLDVTWRRAGHILGSAMLRLHLAREDIVVVFSGDLGTSRHPLLLPPEPIGKADVVVTESTYGDEEHSPLDAEDQIAAAIDHVVERNGVLVVPAFAVDRTEVVLWHLDRLIASGRVPDLPVFVDSPMASAALNVYEEEVRRGSPEFRPEHRRAELFPAVHFTEIAGVDESKALNDRSGPMVIISASGMVTGGRVVHHLAHRIGHPDNAVMLVGFQAPGTRGEALRNGATKLKMLGHYHQVRARVFGVELSAHADQGDLLQWLGSAEKPQVIYVNHGEPAASKSLESAIESRLGYNVVVPGPGERVRLDVP
jgi:metallo-beta-lactamase family protein